MELGAPPDVELEEVNDDLLRQCAFVNVIDLTTPAPFGIVFTDRFVVSIARVPQSGDGLFGGSRTGNPWKRPRRIVETLTQTTVRMMLDRVAGPAEGMTLFCGLLIHRLNCDAVAKDPAFGMENQLIAGPDLFAAC